MNIREIVVTVLAILLTFGVFKIMGYVSYRFAGYFVVLLIMYFYVTTAQIDNVLIKSIGLIAFVGILLGWWDGLFNSLQKIL